MSLADFEVDRKTYDAVERCFERISEASAKLEGKSEELMPEGPGKMCGHLATGCVMKMTQFKRIDFGKSLSATWRDCKRLA